ncbi:MAG: hypothetical protein ABI361_07520 [Nitrososphaera sp.]
MPRPNRMTKTMVCAAISPYLAYWLCLKQPKVAARKLAIGIALYVSAMLSVTLAGLLLLPGDGKGSESLSWYGSIAGFAVEEIWDLYLVQQVRKQIKDQGEARMRRVRA